MVAGSGFWRLWGGILGGMALLGAISLLPTDTSLREVRRIGQLTACLPSARSPFVTGDPLAPGIEVDLLHAIAADLELDLQIRRIPAMGRDFDPAAARISRAQCAVLGGGMIDTPQLRGFLDVSQGFGESGLIAVSLAPRALAGSRAMILLDALQGIDRVALSALLRAEDVRFSLQRDPQFMQDALRQGDTDILIFGTTDDTASEALARQPLPAPFGAGQVVFGLWKGDLTLKRAINRSLERLRGDGQLAQIIARYQAD